MGGGFSTYERRQKKAFLRQEKKKQRATKQENNRARQATEEAGRSQRDAWLKSYRGDSNDNGWWFLRWLKWPLRYWKEKKAWEKEEVRRARQRNPDHELMGLTSAGSSEPMPQEGVQTSGFSDEGLIQGIGELRNRSGRSDEQA
jgi:hypothetical protein